MFAKHRAPVTATALLAAQVGLDWSGLMRPKSAGADAVETALRATGKLRRKA